MNKLNPAPEPTMEEILASIRRIISDGDDISARPTEAALQEAEGDADSREGSDSDIFDLTDDMVSVESEVLDTAGTEIAAVAAEQAGGEAGEENDGISGDPDADDFPGVAVPDGDLGIVDVSAVDESARSEVAFADPSVEVGPEASARPPRHAAGLANGLMSPQTDAAVASAFGRLANTILTQDPRTIEDLVGDMLRPMLKDWLDDNLPVLVEKLVREEIERVSRGRR